MTNCRGWRYMTTSTSVGNESEKYRLTVDGYSGNASNALATSNSMQFSTFDADNDAAVGEHCARFYASGWWFNHCFENNLNGDGGDSSLWYQRVQKRWLHVTRTRMLLELIK